jgi:hypothetical protein
MTNAAKRDGHAADAGVIVGQRAQGGPDELDGMRMVWKEGVLPERSERFSARANMRCSTYLLKALLEPFSLTRFYTEKIERRHLTLRTRIKRLVRKTICFSQSTQMHDLVLGLFVNRYAFGRAV